MRQAVVDLFYPIIPSLEAGKDARITVCSSDLDLARELAREFGYNVEHDIAGPATVATEDGDTIKVHFFGLDCDLKFTRS